MRMLRMNCGKTLRDGISSETNCDMTGVERISEFLRESRDAMVWAHKQAELRRNAKRL